VLLRGLLVSLPRELFLSDGKKVALGTELGRGGEGAVFDLPTQPQDVAKIYLEPPEKPKADKVVAMAAARSDSLLSLTSWPTDTLVDRAGAVRGIIMPKIVGHHDLHKLYGPKSRLQTYPNASWKFVVHVSANVARAFAVVHDAGHVIGDVNHGNVIAAQNGTVRLIDCDSFQVSHAGKTHTCDVAVLTHQPPELQSARNFRGLPRTTNHDNFGLAVLIFQMLFLARHPYSGRYSGSGEMPIERAIRECRYAYRAGSLQYSMAPPPGALQISAVTPQIAALFERAFSADTARGGLRPTPREWTAALDNMLKGLKTCVSNSGHFHLSTLQSCPICAIERTVGTVLFLPPIAALGQGGITGTFDLAALWQAIDHVQRPSHEASPAGSALKANKAQIANRARYARIAAWTIAVAGVAASIYVPKNGGLVFVGTLITAGLIYFLGGKKDPTETVAMKDALQALRELDARWNAETEAAKFDSRKLELLKAKKDLEQLPESRRKALANLEAGKRQAQLSKYLDQFEIDDAKIPGVGPGRKATLESYGIETADDVNDRRIRGISGFGPQTTANIVKWRRDLEAKFVFLPSERIDAALISRLDGDILRQRIKFEQELKAGTAELSRLRETLLARREALRPVIASAIDRLKEARSA
jgi:DNA-binding helix-hairpin-helix protein with protein kinase domain